MGLAKSVTLRDMQIEMRVRLGFTAGGTFAGVLADDDGSPSDIGLHLISDTVRDYIVYAVRDLSGGGAAKWLSMTCDQSGVAMGEPVAEGFERDVPKRHRHAGGGFGTASGSVEFRGILVSVPEADVRMFGFSDEGRAREKLSGFVSTELPGIVGQVLGTYILPDVKVDRLSVESHLL